MRAFSLSHRGYSGELDRCNAFQFEQDFMRLFLALALVLIQGTRVLAQQPVTATQNATPTALQLPLSGRGNVPGHVSTQQATSDNSGLGVLQSTINISGVYTGSVMGTGVPAGALRLSLAGAVDRGLHFNLGVITSDASSAAARAQRMRALSQLLPHINAGISATETQINLSAYGFNGLSTAFHLPLVVGPFHYVQGETNVTVDALSLTNLRNYEAAKQVEHASKFNQHDAREFIVLAVSGAYLQVAASAARIQSQRVQVKYAQAIYDQSQTRLRAGTTIRVDVSRSLVQLQTEQERLLALQSDYEQQKIAFTRLIGLPQDQEIVFTEPLEYHDMPEPDEPGALRAAFETRWDLKSAQAQVGAAERLVRAAHAERMPSVSFSASYGANGPDPTSVHGEFPVTGSINIPIFNGGQTRADIVQAEAALRQRQAEYSDQKGRVEQDVRSALIQLRTATGQVKLAQSNRQYALETLAQSRDRFEAGVTNTVEVVQAQQQEASAENDYISSLFAFNLARLSLARATGQAESSISQVFNGGRP